MLPSEPLRILHLITGLGVGGAETMLAKLLAGIDRTRFASSVVSMTEPGPLGPRISRAGTPVHSLDLSRGIPNPLAVPKLIRIIREFRPTVLQSWMYHANLLGLIAARATHVRSLVWNIRSSDLELREANRRLRLVVKAHGMLSRFTDAVVVNSASGMRFHQALGHDAPRWELIQNGFDLSRFRPDEQLRSEGRAQLSVPQDAIAIGMVARLHPQKDHATFLSAAALLRRRAPEVVFILAGTGLTTDNQRLVAQLKDAGLFSSTRLVGEIADPAVLFPVLDINTLCSAYGEGFPNALGEAMSCEIPCVATNVGDSSLLIGDTGQIVDTRNPAGLANAWYELISMGDAARKQLGRAARARVAARFSIEAIVKSYEQLYEDLANHPTRTA